MFPNVLKSFLAKDIKENLSLVKFVNLGRNVFRLNETDEKKLAEKTIDKIREFFNSLDMPSTLAEEKVDSSKIDVMAKGAARNGTIGYYHKLTEADVFEILENSL